jgi:ribosomal-protein-serine acetyltransferase
MTTDPILIDVPMPILTPRLRLEMVRAGLGQRVLDAVLESRDILRPWMAWAHNDADMTLDAREKWLREAHAKFIRRETLFMAAFDRETDAYIGGTGFHDIDWKVPSLTIGYWVRGSHQGRGYATEMTVGLLHYAFKQLNARRVEIAHADGNVASRRVIDKAGFAHEGLLRRDDVMPDGRVQDTHVYSHIDVNDVPPLDVRW